MESGPFGDVAWLLGCPLTRLLTELDVTVARGAPRIVCVSKFDLYTQPKRCGMSIIWSTGMGLI